MPCRVFLDANVLFSCAYLQGGELSGILRLSGVDIVTSPFAALEAYRNLAAKYPEAAARLPSVIARCHIVADATDAAMPPGVELSAKDHPILLAAIACSADRLITGDRHFRHLFGKRIGGVLIQTPRMLLDEWNR